jgi:hypothetical protein
MGIPVSPAHQEETLVCYPIANYRLECLLGRVRVKHIAVVAFTDHQLDTLIYHVKLAYLAAGLIYPSLILFQLLSAIR